MNDKEGSNHEDLNQNNEIKINIEENQIKQNNPKNEKVIAFRCHSGHSHIVQTRCVLYH